MHSSNRKVRKGLRNPTDCRPDNRLWRRLWRLQPEERERERERGGGRDWLHGLRSCTQVHMYQSTSRGPVSPSGRRPRLASRWSSSFSLGLVCLALRALAYFIWISPYQQVEVSVSLPPQQEIPNSQRSNRLHPNPDQFLKLWRSSSGATRRRHVEQDGQDGECSPSTAP